MANRAPDLRQRIVAAAADLLTRGGRDEVSTRAVSAAAGVQAPAIYRQFGDMRGLLHAAAREVLARYVREKAARKPVEDPLEALRRGWDLHVSFGLANPIAYALMYGEREAGADPGVREGYAMLLALVGRLAEAGHLRVSVPHAARLIHAGACGVTLSLISSPPDERDPSLSHSMRDLVLASIAGEPTAKAAKAATGPARVGARAVALRAVLPEAGAELSSGERELLGEWLDRLASPDRKAKR
jgi:AcrR family transcriptional regulator